ncbi:hypothetical protein Glove_99g128 [Diversispora epigaea]|uniref:Transposase putative helix-turn-helix domain-containing protein n=1 Tax=Diversispora epigaea TaxID=1348612 RepID=A0A397J8P7_9GLOM|nr:hypothetical protein Glove_99g128 [Diversispora epigaea]
MSNNSNNSSSEKKVQNNKKRKYTMQDHQKDQKKAVQNNKKREYTMQESQIIIKKKTSKDKLKISKTSTQTMKLSKTLIQRETLMKWFGTARLTYNQVLSAIENEGIPQNKKAFRAKCLNSENFKMKTNGIEEEILALDPGVRTFSIGYSPSGLAVEWEKNDIGRIYRL